MIEKPYSVILTPPFPPDSERGLGRQLPATMSPSSPKSIAPARIRNGVTLIVINESSANWGNSSNPSVSRLGAESAKTSITYFAGCGKEKGASGDLLCVFFAALRELPTAKH